LLAKRLFGSDPYLSVRFKLFGINIGALLAVWAILLMVVYSLMANQLFQVLDDQLRNTAVRIIHSYDRGRRSIQLDPMIALGDQDITFSLWRVTQQKANFTAAFIDGNPFVDVRQMYHLAEENSNGEYSTIGVEGLPYRAFYAIVPLTRGTYLIRVIQQEGPTNATLGRLLWTLGVAGLAALALTIVIGIWLSSRSMAPMIASWRRQQQFVADASHELRTPLTIIKTNLDVLFRHTDHTIESELHFLANAYAEVLRTNSLIEDLLTLARADSQEQLIEKYPVDIGALARDVVEAVAPMAEEQDKKITASTPAAPCQIIGDRGRLRQLILILVDNSFRYSSAGATIGITVTCDTLSTTIVVADTGAGIEPQLLPRIFDRFVRGDTTRHRNEQGSGLGLSIAKWVIEAHNGTIAVNSVLGKGTTFTIIIPH